MSLVENTKRLSLTTSEKVFQKDPFQSISSYRSCYFYRNRKSSRRCPTKDMQTERSQSISFSCKLVGGSLGKIMIIRTLLCSKGRREKKKAERVLRLNGPSECGEIVWDVYVKEMTYMSTISQPMRERDGWVERKHKKAKSLWKMKCDSLSLGKVNLDHEFPWR